MLKNDREDRITRSQAGKLEQALSELSASEGDDRLHPLVRKAQEDALRSQLEELQEQISDSSELWSLEDAPLDDEPLTSKEERTLAEAQRDLAEGFAVSHAEARRRLLDES